MSPTDSHGDQALQRRVAQALDARAALVTVEPAALGERLARVHAAVGDGPSERGEAAPAPVVELTGPVDDDDAAGRRWRSRLVLAAVASAAAAAVIVAAVLAVTHRDGSAPAPATTAQPSPSSTPSYPGEEWEGFFGLTHAQWPSDLEGVGPLGDDVVASSVRTLVQLGRVKYWAGLTADGGLCWKVLGPGVDQGGCEPQGSLTEPVQVSDGSAAPQVWMVPAGASSAETDPLTADGLVECVPGVWAEASALTPPVDRYARFRDAPTAADEVPASSAIVVRDPIVPGSLRFLYKGDEGTFYMASLPLGKLCIFIEAPEGGMSASTCQTPQQLAGEGMSGFSRRDGVNVTAWLVPDDLDTSGWPALGRVQLTQDLWYASEVVPPPTPEPVRSLTPEEEQAVREQQEDVARQPSVSGPIAPDVVGLSLQEATQRLEFYGIPVSEVTVQEAGSAPSGMVLKATPGTYIQVPEGTTAQLVVAK